MFERGRSVSQKSANQRKAEWKAQNREKQKEYHEAWKFVNKERYLEGKRKWREANPEKSNLYAEIRRARLAGAFVEKIYRSVVWRRDGGICHICREPADPTNWHLEHVVPLCRGGDHSYANTAVSHPACNLSKGTKLL